MSVKLRWVKVPVKPQPARLPTVLAPASVGTPQWVRIGTCGWLPNTSTQYKHNDHQHVAHVRQRANGTGAGQPGGQGGSPGGLGSPPSRTRALNRP
jgi:hypothetical protein